MPTMQSRLVDLEQTAMALAVTRQAKEMVRAAASHSHIHADAKCTSALRALAKSFDVVDEAIRVELLRIRDLVAAGK